MHGLNKSDGMNGAQSNKKNIEMNYIVVVGRVRGG